MKHIILTVVPNRFGRRYSAPANNVNRVNMNKILQTSNRVARNRQGTPQYPGANSHESINAIRKMVSEQPRVKGFSFTASAGVPLTIPNVSLPGDARIFLGIIFTNSSGALDTFTIDLNNNKFIEDASIVANSIGAIAGITNGYFEFTQPLSGKDEIDIVINSVAGFKGIIDLHYI